MKYMLMSWRHGGKIMSSIKNISAANPVPVDLAKRLGSDGIGVILLTLWLGYEDLYASGMVTANTDEDTITVEWYTKVYNRWTSENRASQVNVNLIPINQYPDVTVKKKRGKAPTIDFCFRAWNKEEGYFGAECKRLKSNNLKLLQEYVDNGLMRFVNGKYSLMCSESAMVGYIQEGAIKDIVDKLKVLLTTNTCLEEQLLREIREKNPQYMSVHNRRIDNQTIKVHHLFFNFVV